MVTPASGSYSPTPPYSHTPTPEGTCEYCGLPAGASGFEPEPGHVFCCYGCYLVQGILRTQEEPGATARIIARLGLGAFLSMTVEMASLILYTSTPGSLSLPVFHVLRWALLAFSLPALLIMGLPFLRSAWHEFTHRRLNMDALIAMGAFSAFGVSALHVVRGEGSVYFDTATMLLVLVTVGKLLEASAKSSTSRLVRGLLAIGPRVARRLTGGGEEEIAPEAARPGDRLVVRPGEQIPTDGVVLEGDSAVQEATFTGESLPRRCRPGDTLFGGSLNTDGRLVIRATAVGESTLLGQMARLVREAGARRAPVERLADRMAGLFVPLVWATAIAAAAYWGLLHGNLERAGMAALSVLVVACPCALGLATPLAVSLAIGRAARAGVLIRSGEVLELLPRVRHLFLDKTGTLTHGAMRLASVQMLDPSLDEGEVLAWAAALESGSEHPVGRAVVRAARERGLPSGEVREFRAVPGRGVRGVVEMAGRTRVLVAGSAAFLEECGIQVEPSADCGFQIADCRTAQCAVGPSVPIAPEDGIRAQGSGADGGTAGAAGAAAGGAQSGGAGTHLYVAWEGRARARLEVADAARPEGAAAVAALRKAGIAVTMLSGDRPEAAAAVARQMGIEHVRAACTPADKVSAIEAARATAALQGTSGRRRPWMGRFDYGRCAAKNLKSKIENRKSVVAMVGDGINDAPALAAADVGIALAGGTDLAREAGEVVLLGDDLRRLPWSISLARATYRIIAQNLFWAFGYNIIAMTLGFLGILHPLLAAVLMLFSSLFVLGNSLRLLQWEARED